MGQIASSLCNKDEDKKYNKYESHSQVNPSEQQRIVQLQQQKIRNSTSSKVNNDQIQKIKKDTSPIQAIQKVKEEKEPQKELNNVQKVKSVSNKDENKEQEKYETKMQVIPQDKQINPEETAKNDKTDQNKNQQMSIEDFEILYNYSYVIYKRARLVINKKDSKEYSIKSLIKSELINIEDQFYPNNPTHLNKHPFVVSSENSFQTEEKIYIVSDSFRCGSVKHYLKLFIEKGLSYEMARFVGAEILLGLKYLHENNIVLRDMNLANIIVSQDGHIKISGFGLENYFLSSMDYRLHTDQEAFQYLSPEIFDFDDEDVRDETSSDIWSFGIILYKMMTGQHPLVSPDNHYQICKKKIQKNNFKIQQNMNGAENLIRRCLSSDPKDRPTLDQIMADPFFIDTDWDKLQKQEITSPICQYFQECEEYWREELLQNSNY